MSRGAADLTPSPPSILWADPSGSLWSGKEAGARPRWQSSGLPDRGEAEAACEINPYQPREAHVPWAAGLAGSPRCLEGRWVIATIQNPGVGFGVSSILHQEGPLPGKPQTPRVAVATGTHPHTQDYPCLGGY